MSDVGISGQALTDAQSLYQSGRFNEAARLFHDVLRANPRHFEALNSLGMIYFRSGQFERAQYLLNEALRLDPDHLEGLCIRGIALIQLNRGEQALACFDRALGIKPDFIEAIANRATLYHRMERLPEAVAGFDAALRLDPGHVVGLNNRGNAFAAMGRLEDAMADYDRVLTLSPGFAEAQANRKRTMERLTGSDSGYALTAHARGFELLMQRRAEEAISHFDEALLLKPDLVAAYSDRGSALVELQRFEEALSFFAVALELDPGHAMSWFNRGNTLARMKRLNEAVDCYDRALALQPHLPGLSENRTHALFELKQLTRCPPEYMTQLFDGFSAYYDDKMLNTLDYKAPEHLRALADRVLGPATKPITILDLGCGTGLGGEAFKDRAAGERMDGIDLSPRMLEAARSKGIYHDLILADLETALKDTGPSYDLVLAADTMIYLGDLSAIFAGVARRLKPGGHFLFTVEAKEGEGWEQTQVHRFRHSETYLRSEAIRAGLSFVDMMECTVRRENGVPVPAFAVALEQPAGH